jgi:hypothetical protein
MMPPGTATRRSDGSPSSPASAPLSSRAGVGAAAAAAAAAGGPAVPVPAAGPAPVAAAAASQYFLTRTDVT